MDTLGLWLRDCEPELEREALRLVRGELEGEREVPGLREAVPPVGVGVAPPLKEALLLCVLPPTPPPLLAAPSMEGVGRRAVGVESAGGEGVGKRELL